MSKDKRYHIVSDAEFGWHESFVGGFDTEEGAESCMEELKWMCDPYEILTVKDTPSQIKLEE
ncbi:hypothetical protein VPBG_00144 [Vibrio phage helene 12B3]|uniref:hypothetical protein n=1 Tax=Vibrio phage helene 12B3 TaxID=573173 RepID=UPI0002C0B15E|nr:hypothetical protein VPBG_00144 [Vibrio phage helene 12B3]AGG57916.1 hypothetical protein VPBG_00144 [Vibrio phage helene 12B3]